MEQQTVQTPAPQNQISRKLPILIGLSIAALAIIMLLGRGGLTKAGDDKPTNVTITPNSSSSVTITWSTGNPTRGQILYSTNMDALLKDSNTSALPDYAPEEEDGQREHSKVLEGLQAATTYYFQIQIADAIYDNEGVPFSFATPATDDVVSSVTGTKSGAPASGTNPFKTSVTPIQRLVIPDSAITSAPTTTCTYTDCATIQDNFGKGCSTQDYIRCLNKQ